MDRSKENSKAAFDRQAAGYDQGACGQHARSLYPLLLAKLARIPFHTALDLGCGTGEMIRLLLEADPGRKPGPVGRNAVSGPGKTAGQGGADGRGQ